MSKNKNTYMVRKAIRTTIAKEAVRTTTAAELGIHIISKAPAQETSMMRAFRLATTK